MAERLGVRTTPRFDRFAKALSRQNKEFIARYREAIAILAEDPTITAVPIGSRSWSRSNRVKANGGYDWAAGASATTSKPLR
jgi:hypothetical protein